MNSDEHADGYQTFIAQSYRGYRHTFDRRREVTLETPFIGDAKAFNVLGGLVGPWGEQPTVFQTRQSGGEIGTVAGTHA